MPQERSAYALASAVIALVLAGPGGRAEAQRFSDLASAARTIEGASLVAVAGPALVDCEDGPRAARAECTRARDAAETDLRRGSWLLEGAAFARPRIGPYEPEPGGFRVMLESFRDGPTPDGRVVSTESSLAAPARVLAERFHTVARDDAARWLEHHAPARLRARIVLRFGRAARNARTGLRGFVVEVAAAQIFNESTGDVLLDTTAPVESPPAPRRLTERRTLWDLRTSASLGWTSPDGEPVLVTTRSAPIEGEGGAGGHRVELFTIHGARWDRVTELVAPCCTASIELVPHGASRVLVVLTERRSTTTTPGEGRVLLLQWGAATGRLAPAAEWRGSNQASPPAWVRDPAAPITE